MYLTKRQFTGIFIKKKIKNLNKNIWYAKQLSTPSPKIKKKKKKKKKKIWKIQKFNFLKKNRCDFEKEKLKYEKQLSQDTA